MRRRAHRVAALLLALLLAPGPGVLAEITYEGAVPHAYRGGYGEFRGRVYDPRTLAPRADGHRSPAYRGAQRGHEHHAPPRYGHRPRTYLGPPDRHAAEGIGGSDRIEDRGYRGKDDALTGHADDHDRRRQRHPDRDYGVYGPARSHGYPYGYGYGRDDRYGGRDHGRRAPGGQPYRGQRGIAGRGHGDAHGYHPHGYHPHGYRPRTYLGDGAQAARPPSGAAPSVPRPLPHYRGQR